MAAAYPKCSKCGKRTPEIIFSKEGNKCMSCHHLEISSICNLPLITDGGGSGAVNSTGFKKLSRKTEKKVLRIYLPDKTSSVISQSLQTVFLADFSGSMNNYCRFFNSSSIIQKLFTLKEINLSVIPFGSSRLQGTASNGIGGYFGLGRRTTPYIIKSHQEFNQHNHCEWKTYTIQINNINKLSEKTQVLIFHGDGMFSDPNFSKHIQTLAEEGYLDNLTHFIITFSYNTSQHDKTSLIDNLKIVLAQFPHIGIQVDVISCIHQNDTESIMNKVLPIISSYQNTFNIPKDIDNKDICKIGNIIAYHKEVTATQLASYLREKPLICAQLFEAIKNIIMVNPELLVSKDSVWPTIHKVLHIIYHESGEYSKFIQDYKRELKKKGETKHIDMISKLIKSSYQDTAEFNKLMKYIAPYIIGFMVSPNNWNPDDIIDAIRQKTSILWKAQEIIPTSKVVSCDISSFNYLKNTMPGMPIIKDGSPLHIYRKALRLFWTQWTKAPMSPFLTWLCCITILTKIECEVEPPIVKMIKNAIFNDENYTIKMLCMSEDGIDAEKQPLLFNVAITSMLGNILHNYTKEFFPITFGEQEGETTVSMHKIKEQILIWKQVRKIQMVVKALQDFKYSITNYPIEVVVKGSGGSSIATSNTLMVGQVVVYTKSWQGEPWINLPTIGIVLKYTQFISNNGKICYEYIIQQLDDTEWCGKLFLKYDYIKHEDTRVHITNEKGIQNLELLIIASPLTNSEGYIIEAALPEYYAKITEINKYLMDLKETSYFTKDHIKIAGEREKVLRQIKSILGTKKAVTITEHIEVPIGKNTICQILPVQNNANVRQLVKSGANPSMTQIIELMDAPINTEEDISNYKTFNYKHIDNVFYTITITPEIYEDIIKEFEKLMIEKYGGGIQILTSIDCCVCLDEFPYSIKEFEDKIHTPKCGHKLCIECKNGIQKVYYPHGDVKQVLDMDNCCPQCRVPFVHIDERINKLYDTYKELPSEYVFMVCESLKCNNCIFSQPSAECGGTQEAFHIYCEECRKPAPDMKKCPSCDTMVQWTGGCDHITCRCGIHWCFVCENEFTEYNIYNHMETTHGGIYNTQGIMNEID